MARRSDHNRDELKAMALEAARNIVAEKGLAALSARRVTERMGYSVGTLYQIFANLDALILALKAEVLDELYEAFLLVPEKPEALMNIAKIYIHYSRDHFHRWDMVFIHRFAKDEPVPEWYQEKIDRIFTLIEKNVTSESDVKTEEVSDIARLLWASLHGICSLEAAGKLRHTNALPAEELAEKLIKNAVS